MPTPSHRLRRLPLPAPCTAASAAATAASLTVRYQARYRTQAATAPSSSSSTAPSLLLDESNTASNLVATFRRAWAAVLGRRSTASPPVFVAQATASPSSTITRPFIHAPPPPLPETAVPWPDAVLAAEKLVVTGSPDAAGAGGSSSKALDARDLVGPELARVSGNIQRLLATGHPGLATISNYYFQAQGKHIRPVLVLLIAQATCGLGQRRDPAFAPLSDADVDRAVSPSSGVAFAPPRTSEHELDASPSPGGILPAQRRLAEITEMIHTASLLHDDVIDASPTRRARPSANAAFGNRMAILAGDFLLGRASVALSRLRDPDVVELLSTVIANLVEGELMQLRNSQPAHTAATVVAPTTTAVTTSGEAATGLGQRRLTRFEYYLEKTYMKTASLIAKSCRASAVLGGCPPDVVDAVESYGKNLGLAFQ
ncbi:coq1 putative hexaprenyl diphosphate synthase, partial [Cladochytrium tenue]